MKNRLTSLVVMVMLAVVPVISQVSPPSSLSRVAGTFVAQQYTGWRATVQQGNSATGSATLLVAPGLFSLPDGRFFQPFNINAPITVDIGTNAETVTPTAVSGCGSFSVSPATCAVTATFSNLHGQGTVVTSGTFGLQEALDDAAASGGGVVSVDSAWQGTTAIITAASTPKPINTVIQDNRPSGITPYWSPQSLDLTALATPATRSAAAGTTQVIAQGVGTFSNAAHFVCVTYVDAEGGESPCSATFNFTPSGTQGIFFNTPAASTGAVGWVPYVGVTSLNTAFRVPLTSLVCTLTTLETMVSACAIGSNAVLTTATGAGADQTATALRPGIFITNVPGAWTISHPVWVYSPSKYPTTFPLNYGPFTALGSITAGNTNILATVPLPAGFYGTIGRTFRVSGTIVATTVNTATWVITLSMGGPGMYSTGTPTAMCTMSSLFPFTGAAYNGEFSCLLTTNAVSATVGTVMPGGSWYAALQAGAAATLQATGISTQTAAIGSLDTVDATTLNVLLTSTTGATSASQITQLVIEPL